MEKYNKKKAIVYNTIQMYRKDRLSFLKNSANKATSADYFIGVKLVRGAYMEKERVRAKRKGYDSPIQLTKKDTDRDFDEALEYCLENISFVSICAGTHNEKSCQHLGMLMEKFQIDKKHPSVYSSQLLGMSDQISFNMANEGYNVVKFIPYGPVKEVIPYLMRRAEENTSISGQMGRELRLIVEEKERRRLLLKTT
jgi:proline dehydrogenase